MPKRDATRSTSLTSQESYSAVIIADLVAEVELKDVHNTEHRKERHNPNFEPISESAAVVKVVDMETVNMGPAMNGTDINKGIILNASHISDGLCKEGKAIELNISNNSDSKDPAPKPDPEKEDERVGGFANMSVSRKVAFVFSFLPSILFVLCFAVILPCKEPVPCIQERWTRVLNYTEVTSNLNVRDNVLYSFTSESQNGFASMNGDTGIEDWNLNLNKRPNFATCGHFATTDSFSCVVMEEPGTLHLVNASNGVQLWGEKLNPQAPPAPLPPCQKDSVQLVALSFNAARINVLSAGVMQIPVTVNCDRPPTRLTPWTHENGTDLIYLCNKDSKDILMKISDNKWCPSEESNSKPLTLLTRSPGLLSESELIPTEDGLFIWTAEETLLISKEGQQLWTNDTTEPLASNRFVRYGKFGKTEKQFALFSNDLQKNLEVKLINAKTGLVDWTTSFPNTTVNDIQLLSGKEKDIILIAYSKDDKSSMETPTRSILSMEVTPKFTEAIAFMELDTRTSSLSPFRQTQTTGLHKITVTVANQDSESMSLFILRQTIGLPGAEVERLDINNWDITSSQNAQCNWKSS